MFTHRFKITGLFDEETIREWILHRAAILNLDVEICTLTSKNIDLLVTGNIILVEALEIACSLGPTNSNVERIEPVRA